MLPPGIPAICQITFVFELPEIVTLNGWRWLTALVAAVGVNTSAPGVVKVIVAWPAAVGFATLTAWTITLGGAGRVTGAVNVVVEPGIFVTVPTVAFPPTTPFTSHVTFVFVLPVTCAEKGCVPESGTDALPGVTTTVTGATMFTLSENAFAGSAVGVAVMATLGGVGAEIGA